MRTRSAVPPVGAPLHLLPQILREGTHLGEQGMVSIQEDSKCRIVCGADFLSGWDCGGKSVFGSAARL